MKNHQEHEKRRKAIELYYQGKGFENILQISHRSRGWLSKWLGRFRAQDLRGFQDQGRAPKQFFVKRRNSLGKTLTFHPRPIQTMPRRKDEQLK